MSPLLRVFSAVLCDEGPDPVGRRDLNLTAISQFTDQVTVIHDEFAKDRRGHTGRVQKVLNVAQKDVLGGAHKAAY